MRWYLSLLNDNMVHVVGEKIIYKKITKLKNR